MVQSAGTTSAPSLPSPSPASRRPSWNRRARVFSPGNSLNALSTVETLTHSQWM